MNFHITFKTFSDFAKFVVYLLLVHCWGYLDYIFLFPFTVEKLMAKNVNKKRPGSAPLSLSGSRSKGKLEEIVMDDDMTIGAMKDEIVRKLALGRSKGERSQVTTSHPVSEVNNVRKKEDNIGIPVKRKRGADGEIVLAYLSSPEQSSPRLRPRKEVPSFRMVNLNENDYDRIVGRRVKVYWSESRKWFAGHIKAFDDMKRLHSILYDDGDKEELDLRKERFELEIMPTEGFSLRVDISKKKIGALDSDVASSTMSPGKKLRVGDAEEATKSLGLKNVGKIGSSKSRRKGTKLKKDSDVVPDNVVEVITDKINVAEELAELNVDKDFDDFKPLAEIAAQLRPGFEVKKMGSDTHDTEGSEKTESDDSILLKSFGSLKKETKGAINVKSSKLITRKEINEAETLGLGMEVDLCRDDELKTSMVHSDITIEEAGKVNHQKQNDKTEAFEEVGQSNGGVLNEAQATTLELTADDVKISGDMEDKEKQVKAENITASKDVAISLILSSHSMKGKMEGLPPNTEASAHTKKIEEVISKEIGVQGSRDVHALKSHNVRILVSKADVEGSFEASADLRPTIPRNTDEGNPDLLQEKLKVENIDSEEDVKAESKQLTCRI